MIRKEGSIEPWNRVMVPEVDGVDTWRPQATPRGVFRPATLPEASEEHGSSTGKAD